MSLMIRSFAVGLKRTFADPRLLLLAWLLSMLAALPATFMLGAELHASLKDHLSAETMEQGFDPIWYGDYQGTTSGLASTFDPTAAGIGGVLSNFEAWIQGELIKGNFGVVVLGLIFALVWAYFLGGYLERATNPEAPAGAAALLSACGRHGGRIVRIALLSAVGYYLVYRLHGWRLDRLEKGLRDVTEETAAMWSTIALYALTFALLILVRTLSDYAKIAAVAEDRPSALRSYLAAGRAMVARPFSLLAILLLYGAVGAALLALFTWLRPSTTTADSWAIGWVIFVGQLWIGLRLSMRLALLRSEALLYASSRSLMRGK